VLQHQHGGECPNPVLTPTSAKAGEQQVKKR